MTEEVDEDRKCPLCKNLYNNQERIPRILLQCGHTICEKCIKNFLDNPPLKCPEDQTEYKDIDSINQFPINKALMKILKKINETKNNSSLKGFYTSREGRKVIDSFKMLSSSKKNIEEEFCKEHKNRKLEIICLEDRCKICTNCAIFGPHKNHKLLSIDELQKDIEKKAENLMTIFQKISEEGMEKDIRNIFEGRNGGFLEIENLLNQKFENLNTEIKSFTENLISKLKTSESELLNNITDEFDGIKKRVNYYQNLPSELLKTIDEWKSNVKEKMDIMTNIKNISEDCLQFIDCYGDNFFDKLIKQGNNISNKIQNIISFPVENIKSDINNLNISIEKNILNQEFFQINNKLNFSEIFKKYEIPSTTKKKSFSNQKNISSKNKNKTTNHKRISTFDNISFKEKLNQITENSIILQQKENEINDINFDDDSCLFTDLNDFLTQNESNTKKIIIPKKSPNKKSKHNLNNNNHLKNIFKGFEINTFNNIINNSKNIDEFSNDSGKKTTNDSKKTPIKQKKSKNIMKKTKSSTGFSKISPIRIGKVNNMLSKIKIDNGNKTHRSLTPFDLGEKNCFDFKGLLRKSDKINLSRKELGDEGTFSLISYISKNKEKLKELKLIKCGITDESGMLLLKTIENCNKLCNINLANNLFTDKIVSHIVNFLKKSQMVTSAYFTNNNFSIQSKEKIKSYNRNGKIKIFV